MAPTEILARQHFSTIAPLAEKAGLAVAVLTGREKGRDEKDRRNVIVQRTVKGALAVEKIGDLVSSVAQELPA